jgi:hypothetical protein
MCGRPLTGSWSKGRNGHYAYYHCQRQCRAVNVSKAEFEGAFADELALLQPTAGYMRLVKDRILHVWEQRRAEAKDRTAEQEKRVKAIQQKLDRLDEAFLFAQSIDATSYERQRDRLREELTLAQIDHHAEAVDEFDVKGILAFAERVLPRASDLWVQPGVAGLQAAAAAAVLPGRDRVRRNSIQSNRRNGASFQLLGAGSECGRNFGEPPRNRTENPQIESATLPSPEPRAPSPEPRAPSPEPRAPSPEPRASARHNSAVLRRELFLRGVVRNRV